MVTQQSVVVALTSDVEALGELPKASASLVASAFAMAELIDAPGNSAASKAACARSLRETLDRLRELAPAGEQQGDGIDELRSRRKRKTA